MLDDVTELIDDQDQSDIDEEAEIIEVCIFLTIKGEGGRGEFH